jgi:hypothetical protein
VCDEHGSSPKWTCFNKGGVKLQRPYVCSQPGCDCHAASEEELMSLNTSTTVFA